MKFILGTKQGMTQVFTPDGKVVPATKIKAGPCLVVQKKTSKQDGYNALSCAYLEKKKSNKPLSGLFKKFSEKKYQYIREFKIADSDPVFDQVKPGDIIDQDIFSQGDILTVTGVSKGKGFQGVVKRHGFSGGKASHGHKDQLRMPGSIGATGPARVFKGVRMAGRMGNDQVTVTGLQIIDIDRENNFLLVKGSVPGAVNSLLKITAKGDFKIKKQDSEPKQSKAEKAPEKKQTVAVEDKSPKASEPAVKKPENQKIDSQAKESVKDSKEEELPQKPKDNNQQAG